MFYIKIGYLCLTIFAINQNIANVNAFLKGDVKSVNGGRNCFYCTVAVGLVEQLAIINNSTIEQSLYNICNLLPKGMFRSACQQVVDIYGPTIIDGLYSKKTPDVVCQAIKYCTIDKGQPECRLFPPPKKDASLEKETTEFVNHLNQKGKESSGPIDFCSYSSFKELCDFLDKSLHRRIPEVDNDLDGFSIIETMRGTDWKGKDCNDFDTNIHPGVIAGPDILKDTNCNGIWGVDSTDGVAYEDKFCKNSQQRGIASLGDSITAHFHLPEEWFDATKISELAFQHIAFIAENEIDWPHFSGSTGHFQNDWPVIHGNTSSLYLKLWERNKCNFRDYQNLGVNGADTISMNNSIIPYLSRDQKSDQPLIVLYSLVGNDVCNGNPDTFSHMTKPQDFYNAVLETMQYLDTRLPNGSHVLLTGLANGSFLYAQLHDKIHPVGRLRNDVTYSTFYTYLSCLQISPCNGWLTTNDTVRALTTDYATMLSQLVKNVTETYKFNNFDMGYMDFPLDSIVERWTAKGGSPWELLEPVDGFHINQYAHALYGDVIWDFISENHPGWLGPINPNNANITTLFGDQGGY